MMRKKLGIFLAVALAFGGLPLLGSTTHAFASWDWCWDDPIVQIGNHTVNIDVGVSPDAVGSVTSGTVIVHVPQGTDASIVSQDSTLPLKTTIKFDARDGQSSVDVLVNTKTLQDIPVEVKIVVDHYKTVVDGTANHTIHAEIPD